MHTTEIEQLLERYFEGETTLAEEQTIRDFMNSPEVPEHLMPYRAMFSAFTAAGRETIHNLGFEPALTAKLSESSGKIIHLPVQRKKFRYIISIAASLLLIAGLFFTYRGELTAPRQPALTASQQIAFDEAAAVLKIVSINFNAGLKQVECVTKIETAMNNVTMFNKFYEYESQIINPDIIINKSPKNK